MTPEESLFQLFKQSAEALSVTAQYVQARRQELNIDEKADTPTICLIDYQKQNSNTIGSTDNVLTYSCTFLVVKRDKLPAKSEAKNVIVNECNAIHDEFIKVLNDNDLTELGTRTVDRVFNILDANFTGVLSKFSITYAIPNKFC